MKVYTLFVCLATMCLSWSVAGKASAPQAVPTFDCIGLRWAPEKGGSDILCSVRYREKGRDVWREALPLWFDDYEREEAPEFSDEYRGSIVGLKEGTRYEVELSLEGGFPTERVEVQTRDSDFKIARVVTLPERMDETLTIREGGNPQDGYVLYQASEDGTTIDGRNQDRVNVLVEANFVILRGLTLVGASQHGVELGKVHDVVIENCDISGWGQDLDDGWGRNFDSAIFHETAEGEEKTLHRIVIQNNLLHHPRSNSNAWTQARESRNGSRHPIGPQGISFINGGGEMVIRHNRIYSDWDHMFNDAMGEWHNFGYGGFPVNDSDIYGNWISQCWDDGLEIEGANQNVRVWGNVIDSTFGAIATAGTSVGPCYVFRNIYLRSRKGPDAFRGQFFLKLGGEPRSEAYTKGRIYVFHNTILQPEPWDGTNDTSGAQAGLKFSTQRKVQVNVQSRNNILWLRHDNGHAVYDGQSSELNDFNYDLYNGRVQAHHSSESEGIHGVPVFAESLREGTIWAMPLAEDSPGYGAAAKLPNFNDDYSGDGPDMGAIESGRPLPAYFPTER
ncbi:right-handed parallel beta-helix repeat-containing protein [Pelagicoccus sp. SDUM812002]|uniref:right-handed parallel beta-helix repeat-containing protein n=1 Tax=Pelagicoccus sp. SDUM812002 TaxID=3041266 RepID=UPI00280F6C16|nr:right-handed parallel beta-helix repeat-containing protein [Pelagicoccus sp. SDUM812002]MDQ8187715.1 right-handed parallel beta-helix repeat-containing protein [Pelagicoccus sp. SDUM812002]